MMDLDNSMRDTEHFMGNPSDFSKSEVLSKIQPADLLETKPLPKQIRPVKRGIDYKSRK